MQVLTIIEFEKIPVGFKILNNTLAYKNVQLIEASPIFPGVFILIFLSDLETTKKILSSIPADYRKRTAIIDENGEEIKKALYSLSDLKIAKKLLIIESHYLTSICLIAHKLKKHLADGFIVEIKTSRGLGHKNLLFFTSNSLDAGSVNNFVSKLSKQEQEGFSYSFIENPNEDFLKYFNP